MNKSKFCRTYFAFSIVFSGLAVMVFSVNALADDQSGALAQKLQNPVADLISVPIQHNWDFGIGRASAQRHTINVQPVIPISIHEDWNLITRTIVPLTYAQSPTYRGEDEYGLGDITQSFFFSPKKPLKSWILGAGPVFLYPSSTNDVPLGAEKFGVGPTFVALQQRNGWTYGALYNHLWSVAGNEDRRDVNADFIQPFLSFTTKTYTTVNLNTESSYDWDREQWTVPVNLQVSQLLKIGKMPMSFGVGAGYYVEKPENGPEWKLRFVVTFLFPKK